jgi:hypothetical protein
MNMAAQKYCSFELLQEMSVVTPEAFTARK